MCFSWSGISLCNFENKNCKMCNLKQDCRSLSKKLPFIVTISIFISLFIYLFNKRLSTSGALPPRPRWWRPRTAAGVGLTIASRNNYHNYAGRLARARAALYSAHISGCIHQQPPAAAPWDCPQSAESPRASVPPRRWRRGPGRAFLMWHGSSWAARPVWAHTGQHSTSQCAFVSKNVDNEEITSPGTCIIHIKFLITP